MRKGQISKIKVLVLAFMLLTVTLFGSVNTYASTAQSGMRNITALELVKDMQLGWNLGNTMDATGEETSWGNPKTTKAMIDKVKEAGFNTVRIPITWDKHFGAAPDYTIEKARLDRVEEIVNYVLDNNMYAIINLHHENDWLVPTYAKQADTTAKLTKLWAQIGDRFKNYSDYLIFETMNEPRLVGAPTEWSGGTAEARDVINKYNLAAVNTIRNSGGNNNSRFIMVPTYAASAIPAVVNDLVIPNNDSKVIVSLHMYSPYPYAMQSIKDGGTSNWGTASDKSSLDAEFDAVYNKFVKNGRAVVIGEFGSINKNNLASRVVHAEYYVKAARDRGITPIWWDNGYSVGGEGESFGIFDRNKLTWLFPEINQALVRGVGKTDIYGDLNNDGIVNALDYAAFKKYIMDPNHAYNKYYDLNLDNAVDALDFVIMKKYLLGIITKLPYITETPTPTPTTTPTPTPTVTTTPTTTPITSSDVLLIGRTDTSDSAGPKFGWGTSTIKANFNGTGISVKLKSAGDNWFNVIVDGVVKTPINVTSSATSPINLASGLTKGNHSIELVKRTEAWVGEVQFLGFSVTDGTLITPPAPSSKRIEFIGDSITCGYGNEGTNQNQSFTTKNENAYLAYGAVTSRLLGADAITVSWSGKGIIRNYGGNTTELMPEMYSRILPYNASLKWDSSKWIPQVVVINLCTNDYSTGTPDKTAFTTAYKNFVDRIRTQYPNAHIYCATGPMLGNDSLPSARDYINGVVKEKNSSGDSKVHYIEFPTQDMSNGLGEDWHPSVKTHDLMANQLAKQIRTDLGW